MVAKPGKEIGKTMATLRNWDNKGILKPDYVTDGGTRFYSENILNYLLGLLEKTYKIKLCVHSILNKLHPKYQDGIIYV